MIKKFIPLLISTALLTGCFGSGTTNDTATAGKKLYQTENFSISVPQDWEVIEQNSLNSNVSGDTVVAFRNNIKNEIFTANLAISVSSAPSDLTSIDMAKQGKANAKASLISFEEILDEDHVVLSSNNNIPTLITNFKGKQKAESSPINFEQLHVINNGAQYTLTGASYTEDDESVVKLIDEMIKSFSLK